MNSILNNKNNISIRGLNDKQQALLTQLSYLDIDIDEYHMFKKSNELITIADLELFLKNPDELYIGSSPDMIDKIKHKEKIPTQLQLLQQIKNNKLGDFIITDIESNSNTGFRGIAFTDSHFNKGMSFKGTEFKKLFENIEKNEQVYLEESEEQIEQAKLFFEKNKDDMENNYLFGYSLGGNLASHIYLENIDTIQRVFTINPLPIDQELLDTDKKFMAFSDKEKYIFNIIDGDFANHLKKYDEYATKYAFIKNNEELDDNIFENHLIEAAEYDNNGNFNYIFKENSHRMHVFDKAKNESEVTNIEENKKTELIDKIINIWNKLKNIFKHNENLLTDGNDKSEIKKEDINKSEVSKLETSFKEKYRVEEKTIINQPSNDSKQVTKDSDEKEIY